MLLTLLSYFQHTEAQKVIPEEGESFYKMVFFVPLHKVQQLTRYTAYNLYTINMYDNLFGDI